MIQQRAIKYILLLFSFCITFQVGKAAEDVVFKHYDESIFVVSNFSGIDATTRENKTVSELLDANVGGFRFYLEWDRQKSQLMLRDAYGRYQPLQDPLVVIRKALENEPDKILTLFLDFNVNANELTTIIGETGILPYLYVHEEENEWPTLKNMVETGKRIVIFTMQQHRNSPEWLHYVWDYAVEPYFSILEAPDFAGEFLKGDAKNSLLIYNDYNFPKRAGQPDESFFNTTQNPYLIEHIKSVWKSTGKTPNFIMLDRYQDWILQVLYQLRDFKTIKGTVTFNAQPLNYVSWAGTNSLSFGNYSFPVGPGETLVLTPKSPGYQFKPESVVFEEPEQNKQQHFVAIPLEITEGLEAYYSFENGSMDYSINSFNGKDVDMQYQDDEQRDMVAVFEKDSYIILPKAEDLKLRDHDFTVSTWIKIKDYNVTERDISILGTKGSSYQQSIHLVLRNQKPYFGFYANDLQGNTTIEAGRWYHLVWRYNKLTGEQAIYVDGKLDSRSLGHPSYKGRENIYVGMTGYSASTHMNGRIDDLVIWSRTLGDEEIWSLSKDLVDLAQSKNIFLRYPLLSKIGIITLALLLLLLIYLKLPMRLGRKSYLPKEKLKELEDLQNDYPERNYIQLFGDFRVVDKEGDDVTPQFTPKIKQLFLLILVYSQHRKKGISTKELSEILWPGMSYQNAKNSRGVTIRKLRIILERLDSVEVVFNVDCWNIHFGNSVYCDYVECLKILKENKEKEPTFYPDFYKIVRAGEVLKDENHDWLDDYKGFVGNNIVDNLLKFIHRLELEVDHDLILKLADRILLTDPINDQALSYKLRALVVQNNLNTAKYTYEKFVVLYEKLYGERFELSFDELIHTRN
ncbi:LamG-like jellyroll fold domain-containing protein [Sunxiuqinia indica]|uniref:LamG-like jellyroll fold domain-containing protein n=1 Tax=Sunxiuqinia indica TaxID=2692584 RepID=UPI00135B9089|nr:LamG-like jellyroll fold domain-containing protein [Sunxiuqinia indica]